MYSKSSVSTIYCTMARKTQAQKARAQTLAMARQKQNKSRAGKFIIASRNDVNSHFIDANPNSEVSHVSSGNEGNDSSRVNLSEPMETGMDDGGSPEMVALTPEDWSHGGDPTADHSDHSNQASDGPNLAEQMALQQFVATLKEAQRIAVQLEGDQTRKRKIPKTYRGDSRTTLYCREKAQKALASKGFLDIRTFLAMKQKDQCEQECECEHTLGASGLGTSGFVTGTSHFHGHGPIARSGCTEEEGGQLEEEEGGNEQLTADCIKNIACTNGLGDPVDPRLRELGKPAHMQCGCLGEGGGQDGEEDHGNCRLTVHFTLSTRGVNFLRKTANPQAVGPGPVAGMQHGCPAKGGVKGGSMKTRFENLPRITR